MCNICRISAHPEEALGAEDEAETEKTSSSVNFTRTPDTTTPHDAKVTYSNAVTM